MIDADVVLRPTRTLRILSAVATLAGTAAAVQFAVAVFDGGVAAGVAVLLGGVSVGIGVRHQLSRVDLDRSGARVRNTFRTADVSWDEVDHVGWTTTGGVNATAMLTFSGKARLMLRSGRRLSLSATQVLSHDGAGRVLSAFRRTASQTGVPVHPPAFADDGPRRQTG